jgi:hypothetical protein
MSDPIAAAARAAADHLAGEYGQGLKAEVEAALHTRGTSPRPEQYFDPVSLSTVIVSIATLAWTIYTDLKNKNPNPAPDVVARTVRVELRRHEGTGGVAEEEITDVVVTEIIRATGDLPLTPPAPMLHCPM